MEAQADIDEDTMSETSDFILNAMRAMTAAMKSRSKTPKEAEAEFLKQVSRQQLESCLADDTLDVDDISTIKEMLKYFFNYEPPVN